MSDLKLPGDDKKPGAVSLQRAAVWVVVGGVGLYMVIVGIAGIIAKG